MEYWNIGFKIQVFFIPVFHFAETPSFQVLRHGTPNSHWLLCSSYGNPYTISSTSSPTASMEVFDSHQYLRDRSRIAICPERHGDDERRRHDRVLHIFSSREFLAPFFEIV